jgi:archaeosortase A (PGF-CTERM-specific)
MLLNEYTGAAIAIGTAVFVAWFFFNKDTKLWAIVSLWGTFWILMIFAFGATIYYDLVSRGNISVAIDLLLFAGLFSLGAAFLKYGQVWAHWCAIAGWQLFGLYWMFQIPIHYVNDDIINLMFLGGAISFFSMLGFHEHLNIKWKEQHKGLKFVNGTSFVTGTIYFLISKVEFLSLLLIYVVAEQSSIVSNAWFGYDTWIHDWPHHTFNPWEGVGVPIENTEGVDEIGGISIILACTGIEAIAMFLGALLCVQTEKNPWKDFKTVTPRMKWYKKIGKRKRLLLAFMSTIPVIYVLNLVRNAGVIYMIKEGSMDGAAEYLGMGEFELIHGWIAKIFAFLVLIVLALVTFDIIPELHDAIMSLFELPKRDAPEPIMQQRREKRRREREEAEKERKSIAEEE